MYFYTKNIGSLLNIFLNEKLQKDVKMYKDTMDKKKSIENNIDILIKNDEGLIAKYIGNMIGGNFFTDDYTPKIVELKKLFDEYNDIINTGSNQIVQNADEIKKKTQSILESLDKINEEMKKKLQINKKRLKELLVHKQ